MRQPAAGHSYLEIDRDERFMPVRITLAKGRTTDAKRAFYRRLWKLLADGAEVPAEDLAVIMVENGREDWSFGRRPDQLARDRLKRGGSEPTARRAPSAAQGPRSAARA